MNKKVLVYALVVTLIPFAATAGTYDSFDPATGGGFYGKGDVMTSLGYKSNAQVSPILFRYTDFGRYKQSCMKELEKKTLENDFQRVRNVKVSVDTEIRLNGKSTKKNITGYLLQGYDDTIPPPFDPSSDICPGIESGWVKDPDGEFPTPTLVEGSGTGGMLTVSDGSRFYVAWPETLPWGYCEPGMAACKLP